MKGALETECTTWMYSARLNCTSANDLRWQSFEYFATVKKKKSHVHLKLNIFQTLLCACPPHLCEWHIHFISCSSQKPGNSPGDHLHVFLHIKNLHIVHCWPWEWAISWNHLLLCGFTDTNQVQTTVASSLVNCRFSTPFLCFSCHPPIHPACLDPCMTFQALRINSLARHKALHYLWLVNSNINLS